MTDPLLEELRKIREVLEKLVDKSGYTPQPLPWSPFHPLQPTYPLQPTWIPAQPTYTPFYAPTCGDRIGPIPSATCENIS